MADRPGLRGRPEGAHGDRRPLPGDARRHAADPRADPAPRPGGLGRPGGVPARALRPRGRREAAAQRLEALRQRHARLHRPRLRAPGGASGARPDPAALRPDGGGSGLHAGDRRDPDAEAARLPHPCPPARGRTAAQRRPDGTAAADDGRPHRRACAGGDHAAARALRQQHRLLPGLRRAHRGRGRGAGLRRHGRADGRLRRAAAEGGRRHRRHRVLRGASPRQCQAVPGLGRGARTRGPRGRALHRVRLRQPAMGAHLPGDPQAHRRGPRQGRRAARPGARRDGCRRRFLRRLRRLVCRALGRSRPGAGANGRPRGRSGGGRAGRDRPRRRDPALRPGDGPAPHRPQPGPDPGESRAGRHGLAARHVQAAHRDRAAGGHELPDRRLSRGPAAQPAPDVERALRRFGLAGDTRILIRKGAGTATALPAGYPVSAAEILADYVELGQPATRRRSASSPRRPAARPTAQRWKSWRSRRPTRPRCWRSA